MRVSKSKTRVVGIQLGEATINRVKPGVPAISAVFALVREDNELCGHFERRAFWSDKVAQALSALQDALEEEAMEDLFEPQPPASAAGEPSQI